MSSDSDSDHDISHLLTTNQPKKKTHIWTQQLQEDELNAVIHSANVTVDSKFSHDEFKRYDPKFETGLTGYHIAEEHRIVDPEPVPKPKPVLKPNPIKTGYTPKNGAQANHTHNKNPDSKNNSYRKRLGSKTQGKNPPVKRSNIDIAKAYPVGEPFYLQSKKELTPDMEGGLEAFVAELCYRLREPNRTGVSDLVSIIGFETAIQHYQETEKIEFKGGLPINNSVTVTASGLKPKPKKDLVVVADDSGTISNPSSNPSSSPGSSSKDSSSLSINEIEADVKPVAKPGKNVRRKTPGGVWMNLVHNDKSLSEEVQTKISDLRKRNLELRVGLTRNLKHSRILIVQSF